VARSASRTFAWVSPRGAALQRDAAPFRLGEVSRGAGFAAAATLRDGIALAASGRYAAFPSTVAQRAFT
jgi:hypothetical protein